MPDRNSEQQGRADLAAIVNGIEGYNNGAVRSVLDAMTDDEITRLTVAAQADHSEHALAFAQHLSNYQTVMTLIGCVRGIRANGQES